MADLWIFGRRPAATVRYRHGGFNATFPMNGHTVAEQAGLTRERAEAQAAREAAERERPRLEGFDAHNVLSFQSRGSRGSRSKKSPRGKRPGPPPHRD